MSNNQDNIQIIDAYENNLKHINLNIPKGKIVAFVGVSGSGKSSLVFDTIGVESTREWNNSYPSYIRNKLPKFERPKVQAIHNLTPTIIIDQKSFGANSRSSVATAVDIAPLIRLLFSRIGKPSAGSSMAYSPNHPLGACPNCTGLGKKMQLKQESIFDMSKSLNEGAILFSQFSSGWQTHLYQNNPLLDANKKLCEFSQNELKILKFGLPKEKNIKVEIRSNNTGRVDKVDFEGVIPRFERLYLNRDISKLKQSLQDEIMSLASVQKCQICGGCGLNAKALASKIGKFNISDFMAMNANELIEVLKQIEDVRAEVLGKQILSTLERMIEVGIGYLALSRKSDTLSGGELSRIKIVRNLGSSLNNITYIFDEPTAGLHHYDAQKIGKMLINLRNKHNNVFIIEHNPQIISLADYVIELGLAGQNGGKIVYEGNAKDFANSNTINAKAIQEKLQLNSSALKWSEFYEINNAKSNNLKNISVKIPKGVLTVITGVAGSGKSTLACDELGSAYPNAIIINQKPIGASIRSTPATYTGIMDEIRKIFAKENGVNIGWFSFNSTGACPICKGNGQITYEMAFSDPVVVPCQECGGKRYNQTALQYKFKGLNIEEVLNLNINQAVEFFDNAKIRKRLQSLIDVGLGYLSLNQPTSTLSGGEISRLKLADRLHEKGEIYIFDEPSSALSNNDLKKLLQLLRMLVDNANSVVVVEHRLEIIAQADWIIDLGPNGGNDGGEIIFTGTPQELILSKNSKTAQAIREKIQSYN